jgi:hypothetical protein
MIAIGLLIRLMNGLSAMLLPVRQESPQLACNGLVLGPSKDHSWAVCGV